MLKIPAMKTLETVSDLAEDMKKVSYEELAELSRDTNKIRDQHEANEVGDIWYKMNALVALDLKKMTDFSG